MPNGLDVSYGPKLGMKNSQVHSESSDEPFHKRVPEDGLEKEVV